MPNPWLEHVKATKSKHPNLIFKDILKKAKETYKKQKGAGKEEERKRKDDLLPYDLYQVLSDLAQQNGIILMDVQPEEWVHLSIKAREQALKIMRDHLRNAGINV